MGEDMDDFMLLLLVPDMPIPMSMPMPSHAMSHAHNYRQVRRGLDLIAVTGSEHRRIFASGTCGNLPSMEPQEGVPASPPVGSTSGAPETA